MERLALGQVTDGRGLQKVGDRWEGFAVGLLTGQGKRVHDYHSVFQGQRELIQLVRRLYNSARSNLVLLAVYNCNPLVLLICGPLFRNCLISGLLLSLDGNPRAFAFACPSSLVYCSVQDIGC